MIETPRLVLRRWRPADRASYAAMMADPEVVYWLGGSALQGDPALQVERMEAQLEAQGWGRLAIERKADGAFIGLAGLSTGPASPPAPPGVEIGWRLVRQAWGGGYATEAAAAVLRDGFERLKLPQIVSFTAETNLRSRAVMGRIGLTRRPDLDFDHPALAEDHPLRPHVVYTAKAG